MADRITTNPRERLLTSDELAAAGLPLSDSAARTVASWWQSPGGAGLPFAELASTGSADPDELAWAIDCALPEAEGTEEPERSRAELLALREWLEARRG